MNCPECHNTIVYPNGLKGELVCGKCGLVICQAETVHGFTQWTPKWSSNWTKKDSETLREWLTILRTISCQLNIPNFPYKEEAARIIRRKSNMLFRSQRFGKNKREAITALVHLVLKEYNQMRSMKEICEKLSLDHNLVTKYAWTMRRMIKTGRRFSAKDYLWKYGSKLPIDIEVIKTTEKLLMAIGRELSGNPISLAAGALFYVCKGRKMMLSKDELGKAFHISGRTVYSNKHRISRLTKKNGLKF